MAIDYTNVKAFGQLTLTDLTDNYSVHMTSEAHTFDGDIDHALAGTTQTRITAYRGITAMPCTVTWGDLPTGLTIATDGADNPVLTINASEELTAGGSVELTITINDPDLGEIEIVKTFSYAIAFTGEVGAAGSDAILLQISSSKGTVFKNTKINTTLTAVAIKGGVVLSSTELAELGTLYWYKNDEGTLTHLTDNDGKTSITVAMADFVEVATYEVYLSADGAPEV